MEQPQMYRISYDASGSTEFSWGHYASHTMPSPPPYRPRRRHGAPRRSPRPFRDSDTELENISSSSLSSSSSSLPSEPPLLKCTRFLLEGEVRVTHPRDSITGEYPDLANIPIPFSTIPTTVPKPFVPVLRPLQTAVSSYHDDPADDEDTPVASSPTVVVRSPMSPFSFNKPLPNPPGVPRKRVRDTFDNSSVSDDTHAVESVSSQSSRHRSYPMIVRTQTQSLSVMGGLKAVWKKATARVRTARRAGLTAVLFPVPERDSLLWNGFVRVQPTDDAQSASSSSTGRLSVRNSAWWRSREVAIVESYERLEMTATRA